MSKSQITNDEFQLALYLLKNRFNTPIDLVKYWGFSGPCVEPHPSIEKVSKKRGDV